MNHLFPYDNIVIGILIFIIGFLFHWIGQLVSVISWNLATKIGFQEKGMPKEYKVYEHGTAVADALLGWIYGIVVVGLFLNIEWAYKLSWFPGVILLYHSINFWFWNLNRNKAGIRIMSDTMSIIWTRANFITGVLTILLAWNAN